MLRAAKYFFVFLSAFVVNSENIVHANDVNMNIRSQVGGDRDFYSKNRSRWAEVESECKQKIEYMIGARVTENTKGGGFIIGELDINGSAFDAGLRTGDIIVSTNVVATTVTGLAEDINHGGCIVPVVAQVGVDPSEATLGASGKGRKSFDVNVRRTAPGKSEFKSVTGGTGPSASIQRRFELFSKGRFEELECFLQYDVKQAVRRSGPIGVVLRVTAPNLVDQAITSRYAGLIAQYAILRTKILGLCGAEAVGFESVTEFYKTYSKSLQRELTGTDREYFEVPKEFADIVKSGVDTVAINSDIGIPLAAYIRDLRCESAERLKMEANMLAFFHKKPVVE